jgi:hypothetical protein
MLLVLQFFRFFSYFLIGMGIEITLESINFLLLTNLVA